MKRIFSVFVLLALFLPCQAKAATFTGAQISGCCYSSGPVASAADMGLLYTGIMTQHTAWAEKVVQAILSGTKSVEGTSAQNTKADLKAQAAAAASKIVAETKIDSAKRSIFETPVSDCQSSNFGYYFSMNGALGERAIGYGVAAQRDVAAGMTEDMNKRDLMLGALAKFFDKHGFLFPGPIYTPGQQRAANDAFDLLLPEWKNPRPKDLSKKGVEEARYRIAEARVRIFRSVMADVWYHFTFERSATIPAKEIYDVLGAEHNAFTMTDYQNIVDPVTGLLRPNQQPTTIVVGPEDNISQQALYEIPFLYYTKGSFLKEIGGKGAAAVLKEDFRLHIYEYGMFNQIRKDLQMSNILKAMALIPYYTQLVSAPDNQLSR